jgi:ribonuclease BN (tRNA processing enzyme)
MWIKKVSLLALIGMAVYACTPAADTPAVSQVSGDLSVMVLGSGGPVATKAGRASSGYLIFVDGKPKILMDVGGGTYQRLAQSGTNIKDLDVVLLTHLHNDHTGDLSPVVKTLFFHNRGAGTQRSAPIRFFGPDENGVTFPNSDVTQYPSTSDYLDAHYAMPNGAERYLNIFAKAIEGGVFSYTSVNVSPKVDQQEQLLLNEDGLVIKAIGVIHGPVPALAYRIEYKGKSIVFSGDTSSKTDNMVTIAKGADLLIYDTAIMDQVPLPLFAKLHTTPSRMGEVAKLAQPDTLLLSHITPMTGHKLDEVEKLIRKQGYMGNIQAAEDLMVINLK